MTSELEAKLAACSTLPSPPIVATQLLALANEPEIEIQDIVQIISSDPALIGKVLRMANSPFYSHQRQIENISKAILVMGLNATIALALSFSLVKSVKEIKSKGLDYELFWRRAFLAGAASRTLEQVATLEDREELFIASILQDIGMLVLDQIFPGLYGEESLNQTFHSQILAHELDTLGTDHSEVGAWLLDKWELPERLALAIKCSEDVNEVSSEDPKAPFIRAVSFSSLIADLYLNNFDEACLGKVVKQGEFWLGLGQEDFGSIFKHMELLIPEAEVLFDIDIRSTLNSEWLMESARDALLHRSLKVFHKKEVLERTTMQLEFNNEQLTESGRRDSLTGLFNRAYLDQFLPETFQKTSEAGKPMSVLFIDLDKFKSINDTYGHDAGDRVLQTAAKALTSHLCSNDVGGRYGGEEFVVVLPETNQAGAEIVAERIVQSFRQGPFEVGLEKPLELTVSIGMATHSHEQSFESVSSLVKSADQAMYAAKSRGRNQWVSFPL